MHENEILKYKTTKRRENESLWANGNIESTLKTWGEKAGGWRWMHLDSARQWRKRHNALSLTGIVLSSVVTVSSLSSYIDEYIPKNVIMGFVGIIGIFNLLIQSVQSFYKSEEKAIVHESTAKQLGAFYRKIENMLNISRIHRESPEKFAEWAMGEYERIQNEAPHVSEKSINNYKLEFKEIMGNSISSMSVHPGGRRLLVQCRSIMSPNPVLMIDLKLSLIMQTFSGSQSFRKATGGCITPCGTYVFSGSQGKFHIT